MLAVRPAAEVEAIIEPLLDEQDARDTPPEQQDDDAKDNCKIMARLELVRSDPSVDDLLQAEFDKVAPAVAVGTDEPPDELTRVPGLVGEITDWICGPRHYDAGPVCACQGFRDKAGKAVPAGPVAVVRSFDFLRAFEQSDRAFNINLPAYAIMRRARPYRGENSEPGKDDRGELDTETRN